MKEVLDEGGEKMSQQLKRWESPRKRGRNQKGRGGSARQRQYLKQQQFWRKRLKDSSKSNQPDQGEVSNLSFFSVRYPLRPE